MIKTLNQPVFVTEDQIKQMERLEAELVIHAWYQVGTVHPSEAQDVHSDSANEFGEPLHITVFPDGQYEIERYDGDGWEIEE